MQRFFLLASILLIFSGLGFSQSSLSISGVLSAPSGSDKGNIGTGAGGTIELNVPVTDLVQVSAMLGYIAYNAKSGSIIVLDKTPFLVGAKYFVLLPSVSIYGEGDLGLDMLTDVTSSENHFDWGVGAGALYPLFGSNNLDFSVKYCGVKFSGSKLISRPSRMVNISLGLNFGL